jgi:hypothetical protein
MYNCLDGFKAWAPEIHYGFTTLGQPWRLGHDIGHLLGISGTCGGRRLRSTCLLLFGTSLMNGWAALRGGTLK